MGSVYSVHDLELDEVVALKVLPAEAAHGELLERLKREVRLARRIASPHVCRLYDIVPLSGGARGLTMELLEGRTIAQLLRDELEVDYARFATWGAQIASGLEAVHQAGIVHRDLKPENIIITPQDQAVILDFGIARPVSGAGAENDAEEPMNPKLTQAGIIVGTPLYMSPEQLTHSGVSAKADLYSLGLILAELVTRTVPFEGRGYKELLQNRVLNAAPYSLRARAPQAPDFFAHVVDALLQPISDDRPASAAQVAQLLRSSSVPPVPVTEASQVPLTMPPEPSVLATPPQDGLLSAQLNPPPEPRPQQRPIVLGLLVLLIVALLLFALKEAPPEPAPEVVPLIVESPVGTVPSDAGVREVRADAGLLGKDGVVDKAPPTKYSPPPPIIEY